MWYRYISDIPRLALFDVLILFLKLVFSNFVDFVFSGNKELKQIVANKSCGTYCTQLYHGTITLKFFLSACQCNGHSKCVNQSVCEKCENLTTGRHCETCISGFYGDPTNGGKCQRKSDFTGFLLAKQVSV